jgi:hypothetical protein
VGDAPLKTYEAIKKDPAFSYYEHRNNDVAMGEHPKLIEKSD